MLFKSPGVLGRWREDKPGSLLVLGPPNLPSARAAQSSSFLSYLYMPSGEFVLKIFPCSLACFLFLFLFVSPPSHLSSFSRSYIMRISPCLLLLSNSVLSHQAHQSKGWGGGLCRGAAWWGVEGSEPERRVCWGGW